MNTKNKYKFAAIFTKEDVGGYSVEFPSLPGCYTQGNTFDEAYDMAVEVLSLHLFGMEEHHMEIPESEELPVVSAPQSVVMVQVWMTPFREAMRHQSVKKTLTIPAWLNLEAERHKVNYSQLLQAALKDHLHIYDR